MEIHGKVHCFFEQSGTFKNEFIKLGIPAEDYDIQNNFGETDHVVDLFAEIDKAYQDEPSIYDSITPDDMIFAFFPCVHFADAKGMLFRGEHISQKDWELGRIMRYNIQLSKERERFFELWMQLFTIASDRKIKMVVENPWNPSGETFLQDNFLRPTYVDKNRMMRGDYFVKPTAYWFVNLTPENGMTLQYDKGQKIIMKSARGKAGVCSEERSMISPDYARNFICDFIIGKKQPDIDPQLF